MIDNWATQQKNTLHVASAPRYEPMNATQTLAGESESADFSRPLILPFYDPLWVIALLLVQNYLSTLDGRILEYRFKERLRRAVLFVSHICQCAPKSTSGPDGAVGNGSLAATSGALNDLNRNTDSAGVVEIDSPTSRGLRALPPDSCSLRRVVMWVAVGRCVLAFVMILVSASLAGGSDGAWLPVAWGQAIASHLGAKAVLMHEAACRANSEWEPSIRRLCYIMVTLWSFNVTLCLGCFAYFYLSLFPAVLLWMFSRDESRKEFGLWAMDPAPVFAFLDWGGSLYCHWAANDWKQKAYTNALAVTFTDGWTHLAWYVDQFPAHWRSVLWVAIVG